ncbi:hotdog family protein [Desulfogranum mediterraneum]|uniref:hypothetical protein n=1 Tax=Desulfogranum mediterraneum TaxID=160661 RepID=UPI00040334BB|nr:hypothetical protein [Desulfogranum mediterraneum]
MARYTPQLVMGQPKVVQELRAVDTALALFSRSLAPGGVVIAQQLSMVKGMQLSIEHWPPAPPTPLWFNVWNRH